ncbi:MULTISPECIES: NAD(P)-dependent oxidoreductase [Helcococcus]|uniref:NAD(P)H-binding protein n=2 Tax=Helcococcus bovis TaxID=3153252 RepID=A0ABW9F4S4_9FIRM
MVLASNGRVGKLFVEEAVKRGHHVTGVARQENKSKAQEFIEKDLMNLTKEDVKGYDVVINAFGVWAEEQLHEHDKVTQIICDAISGTDTKLYVVGSAGSLFVDDELTQELWESEWMPDMYKPLASNMSKAFHNLKERNDCNWVYVSPALDFRPDGEKEGNYAIAGDRFTLNDNEESYISYIDYAVALVDMVESDEYNQERVSLYARGK